MPRLKSTAIALMLLAGISLTACGESRQDRLPRCTYEQDEVYDFDDLPETDPNACWAPDDKKRKTPTVKKTTAPPKATTTRAPVVVPKATKTTKR